MLTYGIPPEFRGGVHLFILNRHTPSGQSRVYRVTQLRTDGVHCLESAGTGRVNLKVVPNECCLWQVTMDQLIGAFLSHTHYWYEVGMLKVPTVDPMLLPSGNPFKCHEEVLYLQPMIPPKHFDISPPDWGMLRRSRSVKISIKN